MASTVHLQHVVHVSPQIQDVHVLAQESEAMGNQRTITYGKEVALLQTRVFAELVLP